MYAVLSIQAHSRIGCVLFGPTEDYRAVVKAQTESKIACVIWSLSTDRTWTPQQNGFAI